MNSSFITLGISLALVSCGRNHTKIDYENPGINDTLAMKTLVEDSTKVLLSDLPIHYDSTGYLIHPVGMLDLNERTGSGLLKSGSSGSEYYQDEFSSSGNLTNLVFENILTREQRLLTNRAMYIRSFQYLREVTKRTGKEFILYIITDRDSNNDRKLDYNDLESVFLSNLDGTGFSKLSKNTEEYSEGKMITEELKYYFRTLEDVNRDGKYNWRQDRFHYYYIDFLISPVKVTEYYPLKLLEAGRGSI
jgi:hypothetical protein